MYLSLRLLMVLLLTAASSLYAQQLTQTVRGRVVDQDSEFPLEGVTAVFIAPDGRVQGAYTAEDGSFRIEKVPVGRQSFVFRLLGYAEVRLDNIEVTSGKETILNIPMAPTAMSMDSVEIVAQRNGEVSNEMAKVSARQFSVVETDLYAGSRGEPARMASNFAGVQGADDSRNDIVVRGNTPNGVLWRLEGINIPNPNHFAIPGTGGGPVTILNNKFLANSDFYTGAFPAQYGNGISGAFDLRMRNGNNERHELSAQLGFLGTELMAEGPLSKESGASYLAMYRYSTLALFGFLNINVGTDAIPRYQDGAFRLNFPLKSGANLSFWGIGGMSDIDIILSESEFGEDLYAADSDRDQYFGSNTGVVGMTYLHPINTSTSFKAGLAASNQRVDAYHEYFPPEERETDSLFLTQGRLVPILDYTFSETKYSAYGHFTKRFSPQHTLQVGVNADLYQWRFIDSVRRVELPTGGQAYTSPWQTRWDAQEGALLLQPYAQYRYKSRNDRFELVTGVTSLLFTLNENSFSPLEPRLGMSYSLGNGQRLSFGTGLHSQIQSTYLYYYGGANVINNDPQEYNKGMGLNKSIHAVLGYDWAFAKDMRLKAETYYQHLYDLPIEPQPSSFSLINAGAGFARFFPGPLVNEGIGRNYGVELTIEKFFTRGYYFLLTGSVFDAKYQGSDGIWRNTTFNGQYAFNALFAKAFKLGENTILDLGGKVTTAGGRWYGDPDVDASFLAQEVIFVDSTFGTVQFRPYSRVDVRVALHWNRPKVSHEIAFDLINVFGIQNLLGFTFVRDHPSGNPIREEYQLGFFPIFYYKIDFKAGGGGR